MKRYTHYIQPNDRSETIHQCVFYDCETTAETQTDGTRKHLLEFGWALYTQRRSDGSWTKGSWLRFTTGKELWQWINSKCKPKKTVYVFAHNHFFDYTTSCGSSELIGLNWVLRNAIIDSPPFVMRYAKSSMRLVLVDTLNIWRMSLAQMGNLTGLKKLSMPPSWTGTTQDDEYCRRDVEIIQKAVCEWANFLCDKDMGKFCLTVAGQSMQTYRHRFLSERILIDTDETALQVSRAAYHGGRVECFRIGRLKCPLYLLDINSLYPYVMATNEFPVRLVKTLANPRVVDVANLLKKYLLCAYVRIKTSVPVVPIKSQGKLIFPVGIFDVYVSTPEIEYLFKHEQVLTIHACAVYEKAMPFVQFVQDLYKRRVECLANGNIVQSGHYKLLLNSFSGKWGQNGIKWQTVGTTSDMSIGFFRSVNTWSDAVTSYRRFNGLIQRKDVYPESANSHPAVAAHITAYGRMVLWALMRKITPEHYFYCDTDSLLVDIDGFHQVMDSVDNMRLGALKVVLQAQEAILYGAKDYVIDGIRTIKGIRDKAVNTGHNTFTQERWFGFRSSLRAGFTDAPRTKEIVKVLRRNYDKGIVNANGRVFPFHLPDPTLLG